MSRRSPSGTSSPGTGVDRLQHRRALAGQRRLLDLERRRDEQPPVGRDLVAGLERDDVARARAPRPGCRRSSPPRRTCALIRSIFWSAATLSAALPSWFRPSTALSTVRPMITMPGAELLQRDDADDRGAEQDELHQVAVLAQERLPARLLLAPRRACSGRTRARRLLDLGGVEPGARVDLEPRARPRRPSGRASRGRVVACVATPSVALVGSLQLTPDDVPWAPTSSPWWCSGPRAYAIRPIRHEREREHDRASEQRLASRSSFVGRHHETPPRRRARRRQSTASAASSGQTQREVAARRARARSPGRPSRPPRSG